MWRVLRLLAEGKPAFHECCGASEHGGRVTTLRALRRRGLVIYRITISCWAITLKGREALAEMYPK
jgi:hypothetical protein